MTHTIADALAAELTRLLKLPATRCYLPTIDRKDLAELRVFVGIRSDERKPIDRESNEETHRIEVAVMRAVDPQNVPEVDACVALVDKIKSLFSKDGELREKTLAGADWDGLTNDPIYRPDHLRTQQQFTSVITLTYVLER